MNLQFQKLKKRLALRLPGSVEVTRFDSSKVSLKSTPAAQAEWLRGWAAVQIAERVGVPETTPFETAIGRPIYDASDAPITGVPLSEYAALMAQLMQAIGAAEAAYAGKVAAITAATTIEELNAIS